MPPSAAPPASARRSARKKQLAYNYHHATKLHAASVKLSDAFAMDSKNRPLTYKAARSASDLPLWIAEESAELIRLLETTKTMHWMDAADKPKGRTASYYNPQVKVKVKDGVLHRRVRGTCGGNVSDYTSVRSSYTADMQTFKLLLNAVVSEAAEFCTADISDFYLGSTLEEPEYMWLTRLQVPDYICQRYDSALYGTVTRRWCASPRVSTGYLRLAASLTSSLSPCSVSMVTISVPTLPSCSVTSHPLYASPWSPMTLPSNTPPVPMSTTSCLLYGKRIE